MNQHTNVCFRPHVDHTTGTSAGFYVYIEASYPQKPGDTAWLVSEVIQSPSGACLDFWYHMKGVDTGNLTIYQRIVNKNPTPIWSINVRLFCDYQKILYTTHDSNYYRVIKVIHG